MIRFSSISVRVRTLVLSLLAIAALFGISQYSYLVFHTLAELFSVVVAYSIFILVINAKRFLNNDYLLFIGISLLFVGSLDLLHTLAYRGMGVFVADSNLPTQLWIAARYLQSISLVIAPLFFARKVRPWVVIGVFSVIFTLIVLSIFTWDIFPVSYIEGVGLTPFKRISEYIISLLLVVSAVMLFHNRRHFEQSVVELLGLSSLMMVFSELAFTEYVGVYDLMNQLGHTLKIIAFYLIYKSIFVTGFENPFGLLFRDLKRSEDALREARDELEMRVRERTAELIETNRALASEIEEHKKTEAELRRYRETLEELVEERTAKLTREVAERERAEAEVLRYAKELERSNRDLQDFASIASHDLQEPLRKIRAFGERLMKKTADKLDNNESHYLERMMNGAERLQYMVDSLLAYSRVSSKAQPMGPVDLNEVIKEVLSDLEFRLHETRGQVISEKMPVIHADRLQMHQLFQNLIGNALKFHRSEEPPQVQVVAHTNGQEDTSIEIHVIDNGIGFDEKYIDTIFKPFQRLVGKTEYEGSGMGLAICRKIVERHGGTIDAKSVLGEGTTFMINLPRNNHS